MTLLSAKTRVLTNLFIPQRKHPNPEHAISESEKDLKGKTIVFTGGTDGIGRVSVEMLYSMGASVIVLGRNEDKAMAVLREISQTKGEGSLSFQLCDMSSMSSVKECAQRILEKHRELDVLVNCAGVNSTARSKTNDGFETNWAVNYLAPSLLTRLLLERLQESAPARIVNLITNIDFLDSIDMDEIERKPDFDTNESYVESKLCLSMATFDLGRELKEHGVIVNCLHPGYIKSNLLRGLKGPARVMRSMMNVMASPTEVGADRVVRLAVSSEYGDVTGQTVFEDEIRKPHPEVLNSANRKKLQQITDRALAPWL